MTHYLGIDVGGTKILAVLVNEQGGIVAESREATSQQGETALVAQIVAMAQALAQKANVAAHAVGVGMPGAVCPRTQALSMMPNVSGIAGTGFVEKLRAAFAVPVVLENDVNLAALGEAWRTQAGNPFVFMALGTGIGMGIVIDERIYRGHRGGAGEIALLPIGKGDADSARYRRGMLETELGGAAWLAAYQAQGGDAARTLAECFAAPDSAFASVLAEKSEQLALAILAISAVLDPQSVCLGGSIGLQAALMHETRNWLARYADYPPMLHAAMLGDHAGAIGAARAAMMYGK